MKKNNWWIWLTALTLSLVGCGPRATPSPTPTPSATEVATRSAGAMQAITSLHFVFQRDGAPAFVDAEQTLIFRRAEGDYAAPDRVQAVVKVLAGSFVVEVQTVAIGDKQWMTNLLTGQWERLPAGWGLSPASFFDAESGIPHLLAEGMDITALQGPLAVEGLGNELWLLQGETTGEQLGAMSGGLIPPGRVEVQAWIDSISYRIRRLQLRLPDTDPADPTIWLLEFGDFDQPVEIQPPN